MIKRSTVSFSLILCCLFATFIQLAGCGGHTSAVGESTSGTGGTGGTGGNANCVDAPAPDLVINEISSNNDGNAVDEYGNSDDWFELVNRGTTPASLDELTLVVGDKIAHLPREILAPGERLILWADGTPEQGPHHLPIKLSASGIRLSLRQCDRIIARVDVPALDTDRVFARFPDSEGELVQCRYATPNRHNGATCGPPAPAPLVNDFHYSDFTWTLPHPALPSPLAIDELALYPAQFVELRNVSDAAVDLSNY